MGEPLVESGDLLACDVDQETMEDYGQVKFQCDIIGEGPDGWVEEKDVKVSGLKLNHGSTGSFMTGQSARNTDRDFEVTLEGSTCGFGMSGWGGILECSR